MKARFDPNGLFNPGKIVHAPKFDDRSNFRFKPGYRGEDIATKLDWSAWPGAGGGFQGGAVVASGVVLLVLARPSVLLDHGFLSVTESLAGVLYVAIGILGLVLAGGFLDSHILPKGQFGTFVSAGAIPVISALLGIKVGAELSVIIDRFRS